MRSRANQALNTAMDRSLHKLGGNSVRSAAEGLVDYSSFDNSCLVVHAGN